MVNIKWDKPDMPDMYAQSPTTYYSMLHLESAQTTCHRYFHLYGNG